MTRTVAFWATVGAFFLGAFAGAPLVGPLLARFPTPAEGVGHAWGATPAPSLGSEIAALPQPPPRAPARP